MVPSAVRGVRCRPKMRVFSVEPDGGFTEYEQLPFETDHAEADLARLPVEPAPRCGAVGAERRAVVELTRVHVNRRRAGWNGAIPQCAVPRGGNLGRDGCSILVPIGTMTGVPECSTGDSSVE